MWLRRLLASGADPDVESAGLSLLVVAILKGNAEMVRALLEGGADANIVTRDTGQTALIMAASHHEQALVRLLV